ncbi:MAG: cytochrome c [Saprospiraceae bacterium]
MKTLQHIFLVLTLVVFFAACGVDNSTTGSEYMPDMGHSIAYEANVHTDYYYNTWDKASVKSLKELSVPGEPVAGTVARGYAGDYFASTATERMAMMEELNGEGNGISVPVNGSVPYYYADTDEERLRATAELVDNPFPITADGLARGKELYGLFCAICHGSKGAANDGIYASGIYPAAPANLVNEEFTAASNGRYYHALMYGKNVMGAYKDKISYEERWQVIHYIRSMQAKEQKLVYSEEGNTLNAAFGVPGASMTAIAQVAEESNEEETHTDGHEDGDHSHDDGDHSHEGGH